MILKRSRELLKEQGWAALNIRAVAAACYISVGSVYNYFTSKSDLIAQTVESVWADIFRRPEDMAAFECFADCVQWTFDRMRDGEERYPGFVTLHSVSFLGQEKNRVKERRAEVWQYMRSELYRILVNDQQVCEGVFDEDLTPEGFTEMVFSLFVAALLQHNYDCAGILSMIRRVLYHQR